MKLNDYLKTRNIPFDVIEHQPAYTASRMAQTMHVKGKDVAKTVVLRTDQGYVLAVVPATHNVDLTELRQLLGTESIGMATEEEMDKLFPDCERGSIPPFGSLYKMPTVVDETLTADEQIVFEGNNHNEAIRMRFADFEQLENPRKASFAYHI